MDVEGEEPSDITQPSDDEDRGLLRHGERKGKKEAEKGARAGSLLASRLDWTEVTLGSGGGGQRGKDSDRGLRGASGPSCRPGQESKQRPSWAGLLWSRCNSWVRVEGRDLDQGSVSSDNVKQSVGGLEKSQGLMLHCREVSNWYRSGRGDISQVLRKMRWICDGSDACFCRWCLKDRLDQLTKRGKIGGGMAGVRDPKRIGEIKAIIPRSVCPRMWSGRSRFEKGSVLGLAWTDARFVTVRGSWFVTGQMDRD